MSFELVDIALAERHEHPHLHNRINGKVRAVLTETIDGHEQRHELMIPAWVERSQEMDEADVDLALMVKAAKIVGRLRERLAPTSD
ncbi:hypothetical protein SAMN05216456_3167 [Devosia crocina]|uniref:Uncharacterized protein n=1 Tax=Devosia crocina TaxID=429728 RepID=A0A1I7NTB5_9HYPH|nr:hypothetical protein [Devosia crocina]SFV37917.1 hypothetical protein SAMN05216456_3167 [Devosia crocina]